MAIRKMTNILITGVGGQGNRTLMKLIANVALAAGEEVHALSSTSLGRLSGPITCHIRIGLAASASIPTGEADILVALEMNEALRALPMLRRGALAFIYAYRRLPIIAGINGMHYPPVDKIENVAIGRAITSVFVPQSLSAFTDTGIGQMPGTPFANAIMLGVLCGYTRLLPRSLVEQSLHQCLAEREEQNLRTFAIGWQYGEKQRGKT
jgi:Pyruvate/2-oxoacid:ferredoxin oxidoreductase gamma subunit